MKNLSINGLASEWLFPTTRYRGSKRKILPWIWDKIKDLQFDSALDLFGGTTIVSLLFKRMGKQVTYNDYSYYNYLAGLVFIANNHTKLNDDDVKFVTTEKNRTSNFISENFKNIYFRESENEWLDQAIANILALENSYSGKTLEYKQALSIWALGQACLIKRPFNLFHRKNLSIRTRRVEREFGNKKTWETPFDIAFKRFVHEANQAVFNNRQKNSSTKINALDYQNQKFDLVYLDPPYFFENQRDSNYSTLYHFLDGIAQYEKWGELIDYSSRIRCLKTNGMIWPHKSKEKLKEIYSGLISNFSTSTIVISHKAGSLVSTNTLKKILVENGKSCSIHKKEYSYALNRQNGKSHENVECLIIGK
jgi:adenine-specific DNA-methyltransferase